MNIVSISLGNSSKRKREGLPRTIQRGGNPRFRFDTKKPVFHLQGVAKEDDASGMTRIGNYSMQ